MPVSRRPGPSQPPASTLDRLRNNVVLVTVMLYLLFNWGFMQLRIPPVAGGGLPVGEIVLLLSLMTINYTGVLGRMSLTVAMVPLGIWWTFGVGRALFDFGVHGTWALRDAAHVLESLFLLVGFVFAGDQRSLERFFDWLPKLLFICVLYGLLYPLRVEIWMLSPTITSGTGFNVPIFGSMTNTAQLMIMAALYLILFHGNRLWPNLLAVLVHRLRDRDVSGPHPLSDPDRGLRLPGPLPALDASANLGFVGYVSVVLLALVGWSGCSSKAGSAPASIPISWSRISWRSSASATRRCPGVCSAAEGRRPTPRMVEQRSSNACSRTRSACCSGSATAWR